MAAPIDGISLADKIETTKLMMASGADIHALNTVRRHLSKVKGGRLAAACVGTTVTLAISDVVGDDLNAIGSGPGVPDATTWADAAAALERFGGDAHLSEVRHVIARGVAGAIPDTPKPGDASLKRSQAMVIGSRMDAMEGARQAALARGYHPTVIAEPVTGEAREMAPRWLARVQELTRGTPRPACVISSGETTVRVTGQGRGGRNLEFALAIAESMACPPRWQWPASAPTASMAHRALPAASSTRRRWRGPRRSASMRRATILQRTTRCHFSRRWTMSSGSGAPTRMSETYR